MDGLNYKEVNIKLTKKLVKERMNKNNDGTIKRHKKIVEIVSRYVDKKRPLLEIGCREGDLFIQLEKDGFMDLYGIDISSFSIRMLNERRFKGHVADAQKDFKLRGKKFDTVIISHCLEHMPEPHKVISNIHKCLNENGVLYVEVPKQPKEPIPTPWGHFFCFSSMEELKGFFDEDKWRLLYCHEKTNKNEERGNLRCVFQKTT